MPQVHETGRGWEVMEELTELEPELIVDFESPPCLIDDGRLDRRNLTRVASQGLRERPASFQARPATAPSARREHEAVTSISLCFPRELKIAAERVLQFVCTAAHSVGFVAFEVIGTSDEIHFQYSTGRRDGKTLRSLVESHFPEIHLLNENRGLPPIFASVQASRTTVVDFGLRRQWFLPVGSFHNNQSDPLVPLVSVLDTLESEENVCLQILLSRTTREWGTVGASFIHDGRGKLRFPELQHHLRAIQEKLAQRIFAVSIRLLATSRTARASVSLAKQCSPFFRQYASADNELIPVDVGELPHDAHVASFLNRTSYRKGVLLSGSELAGLIRFPTDHVVSPKLLRDGGVTRPVPNTELSGDLIVGFNDHLGQRRDVKISSAVHSVLIGGTGTGKSTLLMHAMLQTADQDRGFCLIDPHGDLVDDVMSRLPDKRVQDVILFDPADREFPIGFNVLEANSDTEKMFLASDLAATFRHYSTTFGDVMDAVLENAVLAIVESTRGGTLRDLKRFLVERDFRAGFLETVEDPTIRNFWNCEFPTLPGKAQNSIAVRLDSFLRQKLVRNIVVQKKSGFDLRDVFEKQKILLVKLSQGLIGEENANLLGTLMISRLYQIALTRQDIEQRQRSLYSVYIDEASNFVGSPSMGLILTNLRKFGVALSLATQSYRQFENRDKNIADAVLANCQNRICFRLGDRDADKLSSGFAHFDAQAFQNLDRGHAIVRIDRAENDFNLRTLPPNSLNEDEASCRRDRIRENSRRRYATPLEKVDPVVSRTRPATRSEPPVVGAAGVQTDVGEAVRAESHAQPAVSRVAGAESAYHRDIQIMIKRMAESYGLRAEIEKPVSDGRVDVSIECEGLRIACEVSVSSADYEHVNCLKCFSAGYDKVVVIATNQKKIALLTRKLQVRLLPEHFANIKIVTLPGLLELLKGLSKVKESPTEAHRVTRLTLTEACEFFNVSSSTLYRWVREGRVPFYRVGREYQFERDELILVGRHSLSGKRKGLVKLDPLRLETPQKKIKKVEDAKYRKLLNLD